MSVFVALDKNISPSLNEVREHTTNGLYYIYEFNPDTQSLSWIRLDTFIWGIWRECSQRTAIEVCLKSMLLKDQKRVIRAYQHNPI